jgi:hypothetical protein
MVLLRDNPYCHLCPPVARSASIKSLYMSWSMSCALCFAKIDGGTPIFYHTIFFEVIKIFIGMGRGELRGRGKEKGGEGTAVVRMLTDIDADVKVVVALAVDVGKGENCVVVTVITFQMTTSQSGQETREGAKEEKVMAQQELEVGVMKGDMTKSQGGR